VARILVLSLLTLATAGCVVINTPIHGILYDGSKGPTSAGGADEGAKTGEACAQGVLGIVWGDASIEAAKKAGGITKLGYVDYNVSSVLAVWAKYCTVVHGS